MATVLAVVLNWRATAVAVAVIHNGADLSTFGCQAGIVVRELAA